MRKPDRFERAIERAHKHEDLIDEFSKRGVRILLFRQYAAIRREIRRCYLDREGGAEHHRLAILAILEAYRRGKK